MVIYGRRMMFLILSLKYIQYGDCNETEKRNNDKWSIAIKSAEE